MTRRQDRDRECGRHSGIPECCIQYFVEVWDPLFYAADSWSSKVEERHVLVGVFERVYGAKFRHIPCDACLLDGKAIRLQRCPPDCWRYTGEAALHRRRSARLS